MQNTANRKGYMAFSINVTNTAAKWIDLVKAQLGIDLTNSGSWREIQFQVDPETSGGDIRIGDGSLGTTASGNSVVQKGVTLIGGGAADTYRVSGANAIYGNMMYVQATTNVTVVLNIQLLEE